MDINQIIIILFALIYFGFILYTRRKGDFEEFSVAGRSLGTFLIFASISASFIGPAMTLGLSREGFSNGLFLMFIACLTGVAMMITAFTFAPRIRRKFTNSYSIGDVVGGGNSHNHPSIKISVGIISVILMGAVTIAMAYAGGELVNNIFGFPKQISIAIITVIVVIYSTFGGIRATIQTDAFQLINFVIIIPFLAIAMLANDNFTWDAYTTNVMQSTSMAYDENTFSSIMALLIFWILGGVGFEAPWVNRFLAAKSPKVTTKATFYAGLFIFFWTALMIFIGSLGAYLHPNLTNSDQLLLQIAEIHFPGVLYGIFIIAMIGVVLSSMDTTLNGASIIFSEDVVGGICSNTTDAQKLKISKRFTIFVGVIAIFIAGYLSSVLGAIMSILSYYFPIMAPVILFSVFKNQHHWQSAMVSMIVGLLAYMAWKNFGGEWLPSTFVGIVISCMSYLVSDFYLEKNKSFSNA